MVILIHNQLRRPTEEIHQFFHHLLSKIADTVTFFTFVEYGMQLEVFPTLDEDGFKCGRRDMRV